MQAAHEPAHPASALCRAFARATILALCQQPAATVAAAPMTQTVSTTAAVDDGAENATAAPAASITAAAS